MAGTSIENADQANRPTSTEKSPGGGPPFRPTYIDRGWDPRGLFLWRTHASDCPVNAPLLRTPLYPEHRALEGRLVPFAGYEMPVQYRGISVEHQAVRQSAGLFDVSHMGELEVKGPGALAFVNGLITNDLARAKDGQAVYTCACNDAGTILDDLIVYRRSATEILVVCNASNREKMAAHFAARATSDVSFRDASDDYALLALQGPRALEILAGAGASLDVATSVPRFRFADAEVAGKKVTLARTGYTGEDGVELFTAPADAVAVWRALLEAGKAFGIEPVGLGARDTLRLEARLALYGNDIDETTNPLEAGLGLDRQARQARLPRQGGPARRADGRAVAHPRGFRNGRTRHRSSRLPSPR